VNNTGTKKGSIIK